MLSRLVAYDPELEVFEGEQDLQSEGRFPFFDEMDEITLAAELLNVRNEQELDRFLNTLICRVTKRVGTAVPPPVGNAVGGMIRGALRQVLPAAATRLGSFVGGPFGATISGQLASIAGSKLGLELEGLSPEDREFETARQLVRFAIEAVKNAIAVPSMDPGAAARAGVFAAARRYMPGLLRSFEPDFSDAAASCRGFEPSRSNASADRRDVGPSRLRDAAGTGRWVQQGPNILILDI